MLIPSLKISTLIKRFLLPFAGQYKAAVILNADIDPQELELAKGILIRRLHMVGVLPAAMWATVIELDATLSSRGGPVEHFNF